MTTLTVEQSKPIRGEGRYVAVVDLGDYKGPFKVTDYIGVEHVITSEKTDGRRAFYSIFRGRVDFDYFFIEEKMLLAEGYLTTRRNSTSDPIPIRIKSIFILEGAQP